MKKDEIDARFTYERSGPVETTCDACGEVILESEDRRVTDNGEILCGDCFEKIRKTQLDALSSIARNIRALEVEVNAGRALGDVAFELVHSGCALCRVDTELLDAMGLGLAEDFGPGNGECSSVCPGLHPFGEGPATLCNVVSDALRTFLTDGASAFPAYASTVRKAVWAARRRIHAGRLPQAPEE